VVIQFIAGTQSPKVNGITVTGSGPTPTTPPPTTPPVTTPPPGGVSINAGGSATGSFTADQYYSGGSTYTNTATIDMSQITTNPPPAAIFNTERYGAMTYTIPNLTAGSAQTVTLYFAETYVTAAGQRLFNVSINGTAALSNFDIYASAGGANRAIARSFNTTANASGQVVIQFIAGTQSPKVNGITVAGGGPPPTTPPPTTPPVTTPPPTTPPPTTPPVTTPPPSAVSINAGGSATGSFTADQYFSGGSTYTNSNTIDTSQVGSVPAAVFQSERYGAMTYTIPNRSGAQTVTLYFAETYVTAAGQRVFNVSINGAAVLSNFDIYASAGGQNRAIARPFTTTANASGQVVIQFTAVTENPKINGITVAGGIGDFQTLTVTKSGTGTVTSSPAGINCGSTCSASFATNSSVTLTASGGTFTGWSGACSGTSTTCTVSMTQARSVTATFSGGTMSAGCGKTPGIPSSQYNNGSTISITAAGMNRRYILNVPTNYNNNTPYKLIIAFHQLDGNDKQMYANGYYHLLNLSNNGAIFVAPNGQKNGAPCSATSNGDGGCGWPNTNNSDLQLADAVVAQITQNFCVDTSKIFANGWSYGGSMSYKTACERPQGGTGSWSVRGVAVYSGAVLSGSCTPSRPVAYYGSHGTGDSVLSYDSGLGLFQNFARANGCTYTTPTRVTSGNHVCSTMSGCATGYPATFCSFNGGHTPDPSDGGTSWQYQAVWNFFNQLP
jgi:uncharacterized repeat protein (TIGR02543 family)